MRYPILLILLPLSLALAACDTPSSGCVGDPTWCIIQAQGAGTATAQERAELDAASTATVVAQVNRSQRENEQAQERLNLLRAENAEMDRRATATASERLAQLEASTATAQAFIGQITSTAIVRKSIADDESARRDQLWWGELLPAVAVILVSGIFLIAVIWAWRIRDLPARWMDRKHRAIELPMGLILLVEVDPQGNEHNRIVNPSNLLEGQAHELPPGDDNDIATDISTDGFRWITPTVASSPIPHTNLDLRNRVLQLIRDSASVAPGKWQSRTFPRWDKVGWNSNEHQEIMGVLKALGIAHSRDRSRTELVGYSCLADLDAAITRGRIKIALPHPGAGD